MEKAFENIMEEGENTSKKIFLLFPKSYLQSFPKQQVLDSSELKGPANNNFEYDTNARSSQKGQKTRGIRRNYWLQAISLFSMVFSKDLPHTLKNKGLYGKGLRRLHFLTNTLYSICQGFK